MSTTASHHQSIAEILADFIAQTRFADLPDVVVTKAKHHILDTIGCSLGACEEKQATTLLEIIKVQGGEPQSSVYGQGFKTSVMNAALLNATQGHIFDFDDDHREGTMHPSVAVLPAVLALGEHRNATGKDVLRAYVLGVETMIRIGEAFLGKSYYQGFHPTGTCGVFGAAAGCAALLNLDALRIVSALGIAGSFAAGTLEWRTEGSWQKPLQAGHPAMHGVLAAFLAADGFIGARTIFDGPDGVIRAFSHKDTYDYRRVTHALGGTWEFLDTSIKIHACCRFGAPVADCALDLYRQGVHPDMVDKIIAKVSDFSIRVLCNPPEQKYRPQTHVDAQFSLPYTIAVALHKNQAGVNEFKKQARYDPQILALAEKVIWELDPAAEAVYPKAYPATLVATLKDGKTYTAQVEFPRGDPENPASGEEIIQKFEALTRDRTDDSTQSSIRDLVEHFEDVDSVPSLGDLCRRRRS